MIPGGPAVSRGNVHEECPDPCQLTLCEVVQVGNIQLDYRLSSDRPVDFPLSTVYSAEVVLKGAARSRPELILFNIRMQSSPLRSALASCRRAYVSRPGNTKNNVCLRPAVRIKDQRLRQNLGVDRLFMLYRPGSYRSEFIIGL